MKTPFAIIILLVCRISAENSQELPNVIAVVGRPFTYSLPSESGVSKHYKVHEEGKQSLPEWLSFDAKENLLHGVPTVHDRQSHQIVVEGRTAHIFTLDVKDLAAIQALQNTTETKVPSLKFPACQNERPLAVATIVFDLNIKNLPGHKRVSLMKRVSSFADVALEHFHMCRGKGHSTAMGLKDVMMLTAGPGNVKDASKQGVAVSWQIGCGIDIAGTRVASLLKSSTETGAFDKALAAPVSGWHITTGFPKDPKKRVRRQLPIQPTPTPLHTVAAVLPSSVCARCQKHASLGATATPTATIAIPTSRVEVTTVLVSPTPVAPTTTKAVVLPVVTTKPATKPPTTVEPTTEESTTPEISSTVEPSTAPETTTEMTTPLVTTEPVTPVVGLNKRPNLINHIDKLTAFAGQGYRYKIRHDNFYDKEDGDTSKLKLVLQTIDAHKLLSTSWILLNHTKQEIYALPMEDDIKEHEFMLTARDSGGLKSPNDAFVFQVKADKVLYNHQFIIHLDVDNVTFLNDVGVRLVLLDKLTGFFGVNFTNIRVASYAAGVFFTFRFDFIPYESCRDDRLLHLQQLFVDKDGNSDFGELTAAFRSALMPEFPLISGRYEMMGDCAAVLPPGAVPMNTRGPGVWWTYAIIPAIVLAVLLLIIGICVLVMMKCRRKQQLGAGDKKTYIYQKKPVVFREEFEMKDECLKVPLILPNEKPPLPPPAYPRTPNGSAVTTPLIGGEERRMMNGGHGMMEASFSSGGGGGGGGMVGGGMAGNGVAGGGGMAAGSGMAARGGMGGGSMGGGRMSGGSMGGGSMGGGGMSGGGMGAGGGGMGAGGGGGVGGGVGGGGGTAYQASSFSTGGRRQMSSSSFTSSYSTGGGSTRKTAYSGYRLPPAYVPP